VLPHMNFDQRTRAFKSLPDSAPDRKGHVRARKLFEENLDAHLLRDNKAALLFGSKTATKALSGHLESKDIFSQRHAGALVRVLGAGKVALLLKSVTLETQGVSR
jgi:hypothetical protein